MHGKMSRERMEYVRDVRLQTDRIDGIFEPLKATIALLKKFNIATPEETQETLEMIPFKWEDTKKVTLLFTGGVLIRFN